MYQNRNISKEKLYKLSKWKLDASLFNSGMEKEYLKPWIEQLGLAHLLEDPTSACYLRNNTVEFG